jgi:hypothetical protein
MSKYVTIDGRSYYNPCATCKENSCYSCVLNKYKEDLKTEHDKRTNAEWRIEQELEPRIEAEKDSYDRWVSTDTGERACESFSSLIDELIDFVENPDNKKYMEWEDPYGEFEEMLLFLIKNRDDAKYYRITSEE